MTASALFLALLLCADHVYQTTACSNAYTGCFAVNYPLSTLVLVNSSSTASLLTCAAHCRGYKYYGATQGTACYCGSDLSGLSASPSPCDWPCPGNPSELCGSNASISLYSLVPSLSARSLASLSTQGGEQVVLTGMALGNVHTLAVSYGSYVAAACQVTQECVAVTCTTVPGTGKDHLWRVTINGLQSSGVASSLLSSSYLPPDIISISKQDNSNMSTAGGESVTILGTNFGPSVLGISSLTYGPSANPALYSIALGACSLAFVQALQAQALVCVSVAGAGGSLQWVLTVDGQSSVATDASARFGYRAPTLSAVSVAGVLNTAGGQTLTLTGQNFGPSGTVISAQFNSTGLSSCLVSVPHSAATCSTVVGVGHNLQWRITVAGQTSSAIAAIDFAAPQLTGLAIQSGSSGLDTRGVDTIVLSGLYLGYLGLAVSVVYGPPAQPGRYVAQSCVVSNSAGTRVTCGAAAGSGANHSVAVTVGNQTGSQNVTLSYSKPSIASFSGLVDMPTSPTAITITGSNFGPAGTSFSLWYGPVSDSDKYSPTSCSHVGSGHTAIACQTSQGAGKNLLWFISVDGQTSAVGVQLDYAPPTVSSVTTPVTLSTQGNEALVLVGTNFGPVGTALTLEYGPSNDKQRYFTDSCTVDANSPHTKATCLSVPGVGSISTFRLSVAGQSVDRARTTSYSPPLPTAVAVSGGAATLATTGGETVTISGTNFGPSGTTVSAWYVNSLGVRYPTSGSLANCAVPAGKDSIQVVCTSAAGVGASLIWTVSVDGQTGSVPAPQLSYAAPAITSVTPQSFPTTGGSITIYGTSFGPHVGAAASRNRAFLTVSFGPNTGKEVTLADGSCQIMNSPERVLCTLSAAAGAGYGLVVQIGGQSSPSSASLPTPHLISYQPPSLSGVVGGSSLSTAGGEQSTFQIQCSNAGPNRLDPVWTQLGISISAEYGPYVATCTTDDAGYHNLVICTGVAGEGVSLFLELTVAGQSSGLSSTFSVSYGRPELREIWDSTMRKGSAAMPVEHPTAGNSVCGGGYCAEARVYLNGVNFGTTAQPVVRYSGTGYSYTAVGCALSIPHTQITCYTVEGLGQNFVWNISTASQVSAVYTSSSHPELTTRYAWPSLLSLSCPNNNCATFNTTGGQDFVLRGKNLGGTAAAITSLQWRHSLIGSLVLDATACQFATPHEELQCKSPQGVGGGVYFFFMSYSRSDGRTVSHAAMQTKYAAPTIQSVSVPAVISTSTPQAVTFTGNNFGPSSLAATLLSQGWLSMTYSVTASPFAYTSGSCSYVSSHSSVACSTVEGAGVITRWQLDIANQSSAIFSSPSRYASPVVSGVTDNSNKKTDGIGQYITIYGSSFGPLYGPQLINVTLGPTRSELVATGCQVTDADIRIRCQAPIGVGSGHLVHVSVSSQAAADTAHTVSYAPPTITASSNPLQTSGGTVVTLDGVNLGPISSYPLWTALGVGVSAQYGDGSSGFGPYVATDCNVTIAHTQIRCRTVAGMGTAHVWYVTVAGQKDVLEYAVANYQKPSITSLGWEPSEGVRNLANFSTLGGQTIFINGQNFGFPSANVSASYSKTYSNMQAVYTALNCTIPFPYHTKIICKTASGVGTNFLFRVDAALQQSNYFTAANFGYNPPILHQVTTAVAYLAGEGGDLFTVTGQNFGPANDPNSPLPYLVYTSTEAFNVNYFYTLQTECTMTTPHQQFVCRAAAGTGKNLRFLLYIGGQTQGWLLTNLRYESPGNITAILNTSSLTPAKALSTEGRQTVYIEGSNFGPYGLPGAMLRATYGPSGVELQCTSCTHVSPTRVACTTRTGVGANHSWILWVNAQASPVSLVNSSYAAPYISYVEQSELLTQGGSIVTLFGTNFGPPGPGGTDTAWSDLGAVATGRYGTYAASSCVVTATGTAQCTTVAGSGSSLCWRLTVAGQASNLLSSPTTYCSSYGPPVITSLGTSAPMPTRGGSLITVIGYNFAFAGDPVAVTYGITGVERTAANCNITVSHTQALCFSVPGHGRMQKFYLTSGGKTSRALSTVQLSYAAPTITNITGLPAGERLNTAGGETITLIGDNFGEVGSGAPLTVQHMYDAPASAADYFFPASCAVSIAHTQLTCTTPPGLGVNLMWAVNLDFIVGYSYPLFTSYKPPIVTGVTAPAAGTLTTTGNERFFVTGTNFGPVWNRTYYLPQPKAAYGNYKGSDCNVTIAHTQMACWSVQGVGAQHKLQVTVADQVSALSSFTLSYTLPTVTSLSPVYVPVEGGTAVTLNGNNFGLPGYVLVNGINTSSPTYDWNKPNILVAAVPSSAGLLTGAAAVQAVVGGQAAASPQPLQYYRVQAIWPSTRPAVGGRPVYISGTGFAATLQGVMCRVFRPSAAGGGTFVSSGNFLNNSMVTFNTPASNGLGAGDWFVSMSLNGQFLAQDRNFSLRIYATPAITAMSPSSGPLSGGTQVLVSGAFPETGALRTVLGSPLAAGFVDVPCTRVATDPAGALSCVMPVYSGPVGLVGFYVTVDVPTPGETAADLTWSAVHQYLYYQEPTSASLSFNLGPVEGETSIVLCGNLLVKTPDQAKVRFGTQEASLVQFLSPCYSANSPARGSTALVDVSIALNGQQFSASLGKFTYYTQPVLSVASPGLGPKRGGTPVSVQAAGLLNSPWLYFRLALAGQVYATGAATFVSSSLLRLVTPAVAADGVFELQVSLNSQQYSNSSLQFNMYPPPLLNNLRPKSGPVEGGTLVDFVGVFYDTGTAQARWSNALAPAKQVDCSFVNTSLVRCPSIAFGSVGEQAVYINVDTPVHTPLFSASTVPFLSYAPFTLLSARPAVWTRSSVLARLDIHAADLVHTGEASLLVSPVSAGAQSKLDPALHTHYTPLRSALYLQHITVTSSQPRSGPSPLRIVLDPQELMGSGKLRTDCLDFSVWDVNVTEPLPTWWEPDSCATSELAVWLLLPASAAKFALVYGDPQQAEQPAFLSPPQQPIQQLYLFSSYDFSAWLYAPDTGSTPGQVDFVAGEVQFRAGREKGRPASRTVQTFSAGKTIEVALGTNSSGCSNEFIYFSSSPFALFDGANGTAAVAAVVWDCGKICLKYLNRLRCATCNLDTTTPGQKRAAVHLVSQNVLAVTAPCLGNRVLSLGVSGALQGPVYLFVGADPDGSAKASGSFRWLAVRQFSLLTESSLSLDAEISAANPVIHTISRAPEERRSVLLTARLGFDQLLPSIDKAPQFLLQVSLNSQNLQTLSVLTIMAVPEPVFLNVFPTSVPINAGSQVSVRGDYLAVHNQSTLWFRLGRDSSRHAPGQLADSGQSSRAQTVLFDTPSIDVRGDPTSFAGPYLLEFSHNFVQWTTCSTSNNLDGKLNMNVPAECVVFGDRFTGSVGPNWLFATGVVSSDCEPSSLLTQETDREALMFQNAGLRVLSSDVIYTVFGGTVDFLYYYALQRSGACGSPVNPASVPLVQLEYSVDGGNHWDTLTTLHFTGLEDSPTWAEQSVPLPPVARTATTQIRWVQAPIEGQALDDRGTWALDTVRVRTIPRIRDGQSISNFWPRSGPMTGGTSVTVTGVNFVEPMVCTFGLYTASSTTVLDSNTLICGTPTVPTAEKLVLTMCGVAGPLDSSFYFYKPPEIFNFHPRLVAPPFLTAGSKTLLTILGQNFWNSSELVVSAELLANPVLKTASKLSQGLPATPLSFLDVVALYPEAGARSGPGFPLSTSSYTIKYHAQYLPEEMAAVGLIPDEAIVALEVFVLTPPSGIIKQFAVAAFQGFSPVRNEFSNTFEFYAPQPNFVYRPRDLDGTTLPSNAWWRLTLDRPILLQTAESILTLEFTQNGNSSGSSSGSLGYRHVFETRGLRWFGNAVNDVYPFENTVPFYFPWANLISESVVPMLRLCTISGCKQQFAVQLELDLGATLWGRETRPGDRWRLGAAFNGQQYVYGSKPNAGGDISRYDDSPEGYSIEYISPASAPAKSNAEVRIVGQGFGQALALDHPVPIIALFRTEVDAGAEGRRMMTANADVQEELRLCEAISETELECATPYFQPSIATVEVSLNARDFREPGLGGGGGLFLFYTAPFLTQVRPPSGESAGGVVVTVTGSDFFRLPGRFNSGSSASKVACLFMAREELEKLNAGEFTQKSLPSDVNGDALAPAVLAADPSQGMSCVTPPRDWADEWEIAVTFNGVHFHGVSEKIAGIPFLFESCLPGKASPHYTVKCAPCAPGTYAPSQGLTECLVAPTGTFQALSGQAETVPCPPHSTTQSPFFLTSLDPGNAESFEQPVPAAPTSGAWLESNCSCKPGFYSDLDSVARQQCTLCCTPCSAGAICPGSVSPVDYTTQIQPFPRVGFYKVAADGLVDFKKCSPPSSCLGGPVEARQCSTGYKGLLCGTCEVGFFRDGILCTKCPPVDAFVLILMILGLIGVLYVFALIAPFIKGLGAPRIFVNYVATAVAFKFFSIKWPQIVLDFLELLRFLNINIDLVQPECQVAITFQGTYLLLQLTPLVLCFLLGAFCALDLLANKHRLRHEIRAIQARQKFLEGDADAYKRKGQGRFEDKKVYYQIWDLSLEVLVFSLRTFKYILQLVVILFMTLTSFVIVVFLFFTRLCRCRKSVPERVALTLAPSSDKPTSELGVDGLGIPIDQEEQVGEAAFVPPSNIGSVPPPKFVDARGGDSMEKQDWLSLQQMLLREEEGQRMAVLDHEELDAGEEEANREEDYSEAELLQRPEEEKARRLEGKQDGEREDSELRATDEDLEIRHNVEQLDQKQQHQQLGGDDSKHASNRSSRSNKSDDLNTPPPPPPPPPSPPPPPLKYDPDHSGKNGIRSGQESPALLSRNVSANSHSMPALPSRDVSLNLQTLQAVEFGDVNPSQANAAYFNLAAMGIKVSVTPSPTPESSVKRLPTAERKGEAEVLGQPIDEENEEEDGAEEGGDEDADAEQKAQQKAKLLEPDRLRVLPRPRYENLDNATPWLFLPSFRPFLLNQYVMRDGAGGSKETRESDGDFEVYRHQISSIVETIYLTEAEEMAAQYAAANDADVHVSKAGRKAWNADLARALALQRAERRARQVENSTLNALVMMLMFSHLPLLTRNLELFACTNLIGEQRVLIVNPDITCGSPEHRVLSGWAVLFTLLWGVLMPLLLFLYLWYLSWSHQLHLPKNKARFGYYHLKYTREYWMWEFVILIRKSALVWVFVFFTGDEDKFNQLQRAFSPFSEQLLNTLETTALSAEVVVLLVGTIFLTEQVPHASTSNVVMGWCVVLILFVALLFIGYHTWKEVTETLPFMYDLLTPASCEKAFADATASYFYQEKRRKKQKQEEEGALEVVAEVAMEHKSGLRRAHRKHQKQIEKRLDDAPVLSEAGEWCTREWLRDFNTPPRDAIRFVAYTRSLAAKALEDLFAISSETLEQAPVAPEDQVEGGPTGKLDKFDAMLVERRKRVFGYLGAADVYINDTYRVPVSHALRVRDGLPARFLLFRSTRALLLAASDQPAIGSEQEKLADVGKKEEKKKRAENKSLDAEPELVEAKHGNLSALPEHKAGNDLPSLEQKSTASVCALDCLASVSLGSLRSPAQTSAGPTRCVSAISSSKRGLVAVGWSDGTLELWQLGRASVSGDRPSQAEPRRITMPGYHAGAINAVVVVSKRCPISWAHELRGLFPQQQLESPTEQQRALSGPAQSQHGDKKESKHAANNESKHAKNNAEPAMPAQHSPEQQKAGPLYDFVLTASSDGTMQICLDGGQVVFVSTEQDRVAHGSQAYRWPALTCMAVTPQSRFAVCGDATGRVTLYRLDSLNIPHHFHHSTRIKVDGPVRSGASSSGYLLDHLLPYFTVQRVVLSNRHQSSVRGLALAGGRILRSRRAKRWFGKMLPPLAVSWSARTVRMWDVLGGRLRISFQLQDDVVQVVCVHRPAGLLLVVGCLSGLVYLYKLRRKKIKGSTQGLLRMMDAREVLRRYSERKEVKKGQSAQARSRRFSASCRTAQNGTERGAVLQLALVPPDKNMLVVLSDNALELWNLPERLKLCDISLAGHAWRELLLTAAHQQAREKRREERKLLRAQNVGVGVVGGREYGVKIQDGDLSRQMMNRQLEREVKVGDENGDLLNRHLEREEKGGVEGDDVLRRLHTEGKAGKNKESAQEEQPLAEGDDEVVPEEKEDSLVFADEGHGDKASQAEGRAEGKAEIDAEEELSLLAGANENEPAEEHGEGEGGEIDDEVAPLLAEGNEQAEGQEEGEAGHIDEVANLLAEGKEQAQWNGEGKAGEVDGEVAQLFAEGGKGEGKAEVEDDQVEQLLSRMEQPLEREAAGQDRKHAAEAKHKDIAAAAAVGALEPARPLASRPEPVQQPLAEIEEEEEKMGLEEEAQLLRGRVRRVELSTDGRFMQLCLSNGGVLTWRLRRDRAGGAVLSPSPLRGLHASQARTRPWPMQRLQLWGFLLDDLLNLQLSKAEIEQASVQARQALAYQQDPTVQQRVSLLPEAQLPTYDRFLRLRWLISSLMALPLRTVSSMLEVATESYGEREWKLDQIQARWPVLPIAIPRGCVGDEKARFTQKVGMQLAAALKDPEETDDEIDTSEWHKTEQELEQDEMKKRKQMEEDEALAIKLTAELLEEERKAAESRKKQKEEQDKMVKELLEAEEAKRKEIKEIEQATHQEQQKQKQEEEMAELMAMLEGKDNKDESEKAKQLAGGASERQDVQDMQMKMQLRQQEMRRQAERQLQNVPILPIPVSAPSATITEVACPMCTFLNNPRHKHCQVCGGPLPKDDHAGGSAEQKERHSNPGAVRNLLNEAEQEEYKEMLAILQGMGAGKVQKQAKAEEEKEMAEMLSLLGQGGSKEELKQDMEEDDGLEMLGLVEDQVVKENEADEAKQEVDEEADMAEMLALLEGAGGKNQARDAGSKRRLRSESVSEHRIIAPQEEDRADEQKVVAQGGEGLAEVELAAGIGSVGVGKEREIDDQARRMKTAQEEEAKRREEEERQLAARQAAERKEKEEKEQRKQGEEEARKKREEEDSRQKAAAEAEREDARRWKEEEERRLAAEKAEEAKKLKEEEERKLAAEKAEEARKLKEEQERLWAVQKTEEIGRLKEEEDRNLAAEKAEEAKKLKEEQERQRKEAESKKKEQQRAEQERVQKEEEERKEREAATAKILEEDRKEKEAQAVAEEKRRQEVQIALEKQRKLHRDKQAIMCPHGQVVSVCMLCKLESKKTKAVDKEEELQGKQQQQQSQQPEPHSKTQQQSQAPQHQRQPSSLRKLPRLQASPRETETPAQQSAALPALVDMSAAEVQTWLETTSFKSMAPLFAQNGIDGEILVELTLTDLEELGIKLEGRRKALMKKIQQVHMSQQGAR
eukprot:g26443.t1